MVGVTGRGSGGGCREGKWWGLQGGGSQEGEVVGVAGRGSGGGCRLHNALPFSSLQC